MKKLIEQIMKFGVVGVVCFLIDFAITMIVSALLRNYAGMETGTAALIAAFFGFTISVIINYILSMKFVFERKEDMDRKKEFIIFTILSLIGLGIHEVIILVCIDLIYGNWTWLNQLLSPTLATAGGKIFATGIVMIYNFITRKIFLEKKED
nr:GtrA family protein [Lachnospiraceae bacterium]